MFKKNIGRTVVSLVVLAAILFTCGVSSAFARYSATWSGKATESSFDASALITSTLATLEITNMQKEYVRGSEINPVVRVHYQDPNRQSRVLSANEYVMTGDTNTTQPGVHILNFSYTEEDETATATVTFNVNAVSGIIAELTKGVYNKNEKPVKADFIVKTVDNKGNSAQVDNFTISNVDTSTGGIKTVTVTYTCAEGTFTATCSFEVMALKVLNINYNQYDGTYHRMWWFGAGNYDVSGWKAYPEFHHEIDETTLVHSGANGEEIVGFEKDWHLIQRWDNESPLHGVENQQGLEFLSDNNWYGLTVNNALPYTTLGINCVVGYDAPVVGFGYYIDDDLSTLKYSAPALLYDGTVNAAYRSYGKYGAHAFVSFTLYDFEPGETYTVHWVIVFEDGIQSLTDWTINMKPADASDKSFVDTEKPNVNVIIMAGQSNMFGASPITNDIREKYAGIDYSNVYIHYKNLNFNEQNNLQTYFYNDGFDTYKVGIGGQSTTHFGPEMLVAALLAQTPGLNQEKWYIIKYAAAGTGLTAQWTNNCIIDGKTSNLTNEMLEYVQEAIDGLSEQYDVKVRSFMWMQGETDAVWQANASQYAAAEKLLVSRVRETFSAYATRAAEQPSVKGSGISFITAGIADNDTDFPTAQGGPNDWAYAEIVNAGKISNSEWLCTENANNANFTPSKGPLKGYIFQDINGAFTPSVKNPNQSNVIVNSIYLDTSHLLSKKDSVNEHSQYILEGDLTDWAHYGAAAMEDLGGLFGAGLHFLITQNG